MIHKSNSRRPATWHRRGLLVIQQLEDRRQMAADFELLKDINATPKTAGSNPRNIVEVGSLTFFTATTATHGTELWKSDGTKTGTVRVKDKRGRSRAGFLFSTKVGE